MKRRPKRRPGEEPTAILTREAYERLSKELESLKGEGRRRMAERLQRAREHGDIRENAEYDAAKDAQGLMEARVRELERMLEDPDLMDGPADAGEAAPGVLITVRSVDEDEEEEVFLLAVSKEERTAGARTVSLSSPLGRALLGRGVGDLVSYDAPGGTFTFEVLGLEPHAD